MEGLTRDRNLDEDDFNFLYHLEQISGALLLNRIPVTTSIILPNLRIIRGQQLLEKSYAMIVRGVGTVSIILPELHEISRGSVLVDQSSDNPLCNWITVNWHDIIDNGNITNSILQFCRFEGNCDSWLCLLATTGGNFTEVYFLCI